MGLSQDEINAMLGGADLAGEAAGETGESAAAEPDSVPLSGPEAAGNGMGEMPVDALTPDEVDVLGEIGNICMGAVATTMYTLLDKRVSITTPHVSLHTSQEVLNSYKIPFVVVRVEYVEGVRGNNLLVLRETDAALITDLLMGGDGTVEEPVVLSEMHLSAISEIMNQMMGASSTALSKLMHTTINISPPQSMNVSPDKDVSVMLDNTDVVIKISFDMEIEGLLKSELLQILPYKLGLDLAKKFMESGMGVPAAVVETAEMPGDIPMEAPPVSQDTPPVPPEPAPVPPPPPQMAAHPAYQQPYTTPYQQPAPQQNFVDVHPMHYQSFDNPDVQSVQQKSIDMIYDIPLQVTVELGKTKKEISEILEFGAGTIVVLDKIAGDPVEIIVNGKLIARGEVVVIEDNYGVRITEIVNN